jgi:hypothetical protein
VKEDEKSMQMKKWTETEKVVLTEMETIREALSPNVGEQKAVEGSGRQSKI